MTFNVPDAGKLSARLAAWLPVAVSEFRDLANELAGKDKWFAGRLLSGAGLGIRMEAWRRLEAGDRSLVDAPEQHGDLFEQYLRELDVTLRSDTDFPLFNTTVELRRGCLVGFATAIVRRGPIAEDLVQEACFRLYMFLKTCKWLGLPEGTDDDFKPLLYKTVEQRAKDWLRARRETVELPVFLMANRENPLADLERAEVAKKLTPQEALAFKLVYEDGLPLTDVAKVQGVTMANLYVILHRARLKIREHLK